MKEIFFTLGLIFSSITFGHAQCWNEISKLYAIKDDGTLWNFANGDTVQIGTENNWWKISAGYDHCLAIKTDSTLWGWGNHDHAQLGLGYDPTMSFYYPNPVSLGNDHDWVRVSAGVYSSMFLKANGNLFCAGANTYGELGIGSTSAQWTIIPVSGVFGEVKNVSTGSNGTFLIKNNGTLWFAGTRYFLDENDSNNQLTFEQQGTATDWDTVATGLGHYLLLKTNGQLWAGGFNSYGQVGDGTYQHVNVPVQIGLESWSKIVANMYNSVGLKTEGTLHYWGGNTQIGTPTQIGLQSDFTNLSENLTTRTYGLYEFAGGNTSLKDDCGVNLGLEYQPIYKPVIYPNPVTETLYLKDIPGNAKITIHSIDGRVVKIPTNGKQEIDVKNLENGTYILTISLENNQYTIKFIKQ